MQILTQLKSIFHWSAEKNVEGWWGWGLGLYFILLMGKRCIDGLVSILFKLQVYENIIKWRKIPFLWSYQKNISNYY